MKFNGGDRTPVAKETKILEGIKLKGEIDGVHNLYLDGEFDGKIELTALLVVGKTGRLKGEVKAKDVIIEGEVEGKLSVSGNVEVRDSGKYIGDILAPSILVSNKAFFQANVKMTKDGQIISDTVTPDDGGNGSDSFDEILRGDEEIVT